MFYAYARLSKRLLSRNYFEYKDVKTWVFNFLLEKSEKFWRTQIASWRQKILIGFPAGADVKKVISGPVNKYFNMQHKPNGSCACT